MFKAGILHRSTEEEESKVCEHNQGFFQIESRTDTDAQVKSVPGLCWVHSQSRQISKTMRTTKLNWIKKSAYHSQSQKSIYNTVEQTNQTSQ